MWRKADKIGGEYKRVPALARYIVCGIAVGVMGEIVGCLFGRGNAGERLTPLEFHRYRYFVRTYHDRLGDYD